MSASSAASDAAWLAAQMTEHFPYLLKPGAGGTLRVVSMIHGRYLGGDKAAELARDYRVPTKAVHAAVAWWAAYEARAAIARGRGRRQPRAYE